VKDLAIGALVILPHNLGTWRDAVAVKASELVTVPPEIDPVHAAMLKINPMTAWRLLHDYVDLKSGEWLIQNAANSAAGRAVIEIAHDLGYKTVNVVRREELIDELRAEGGDVVLVDGGNLREEVKHVTNSAPIRLGLNAVGGDSALPRKLSRARLDDGDLRRHELASAENSNGLLIFKDLRFRGFGLTNGAITRRWTSERKLFSGFSKWRSADY
jgi:trans-2-enoyl-CoA reductase